MSKENYICRKCGFEFSAISGEEEPPDCPECASSEVDGLERATYGSTTPEVEAWDNRRPGAEVVKEEQIIKDGKTYTIRLVRTENGFAAAGYDGDRQVTALHSITDEMNEGFCKKFGKSYAPQLMNDVKNDITNCLHL